MKKTIKLFVTAALLIACIVAASLPAHASADLYVKLSECVPLSAVSCWFTGSDGRVYIGLDANTDTTGINYSEQLSDVPDFLAYVYDSEYYGAAEPPVRCGESHLSGLTEPLRSL